jgi:hypothetical protein
LEYNIQVANQKAKLKKKLLVFIPCHTDYEMAFQNAEKLIDQVDHAGNDINLDVEIVISINGVVSVSGRMNHPRLTIKHVQEVIGADANITKGFITALELRPDYFWILSANEEINSQSILNLSNCIELQPQASLFIANAKNRTGQIKLRSVFVEAPDGLALGLISGVVYNFEATSNSYHQSTLFSWTGWGHLAVIHHHLSDERKSVVFEFPDHLIYQKPYTFTPENKGEYSEREVVRNIYTHSFFGLPSLAFCVLQEDLTTLRSFQNEWLKNNWYKIRSFDHTPKFGDELKLRRSIWIRSICQKSFMTFRIQRLIYFVSSKLPIRKFAKNGFAIVLLNLYKKMN